MILCVALKYIVDKVWMISFTQRVHESTWKWIIKKIFSLQWQLMSLLNNPFIIWVLCLINRMCKRKLDETVVFNIRIVVVPYVKINISITWRWEPWFFWKPSLLQLIPSWCHTSILWVNKTNPHLLHWWCLGLWKSLK